MAQIIEAGKWAGYSSGDIVPHKACKKCGSEKRTVYHGGHSGPRANRGVLFCAKCSREKTRYYRESNPGKYRKLAREIYWSDPGKAADKHRRFLASPAGKASTRRRNTKKRLHRDLAVSDNIPYQKLPYCQICFGTEDLTEEHVMPLRQGGDDILTNKWTMCKSCNSSKGYRTWPGCEDWPEWVERRKDRLDL